MIKEFKVNSSDIKEEIKLDSYDKTKKAAQRTDAGPTYGFKAKIKVKNISYRKKVTMHFKSNKEDEWKDVDAKYLEGPGKDGYEIWEVDSGYTGNSIEYALKYEVEGQIYWDNNFGKNYKG